MQGEYRRFPRTPRPLLRGGDNNSASKSKIDCSVAHATENSSHSPPYKEEIASLSPPLLRGGGWEVIANWTTSLPIKRGQRCQMSFDHNCITSTDSRLSTANSFAPTNPPIIAGGRNYKPSPAARHTWLRAAAIGSGNPYNYKCLISEIAVIYLDFGFLACNCNFSFSVAEVRVGRWKRWQRLKSSMMAVEAGA